MSQARKNSLTGSPEQHSQDSDCTINPKTGCCYVCGVDHSGECPECHGRAYHAESCTTMRPTSASAEPETTPCGCEECSGFASARRIAERFTLAESLRAVLLHVGGHTETDFKQTLPLTWSQSVREARAALAAFDAVRS